MKSRNFSNLERGLKFFSHGRICFILFAPGAQMFKNIISDHTLVIYNNYVSGFGMSIDIELPETSMSLLRIMRKSLAER